MAEVDTPADEPERIAALLRDHGVPGLIDVHTHFMPRPVMDKVWAYFDQVGPLTGRSWPIAYRLDEADRIEALRERSVRRFTSLFYAHKPGMAAWLNAWGAEFAARTSDCLHSATFYPEPEAPDYVSDALAAGAQVFKVHVQVGDYDPNDPLLDGVWEQLAASGTPIVIHVGSGPAPGRFTGPERAARLIERFGDLRLVIAHMGLPEYGAFLDLAERHPHVHLDTTMTFTAFTEETHPFPPEEHDRLVELGDRILFGTDYPNIPHPYVAAVQSVVDLDLGDDWLRAVLHNNAARLFGLG